MPAYSADELREQMARIRTRARRKASRLGEESRQFLDWKHYVRLFPWGSLAVAAAVGFLVVPRRARVVRPDPQELAELVRKNQIAISPPPAKRRPGILESLVSTAGSMLVRAAVGYFSQHAARMMQSAMSMQAPQGEPSYEHARH